MDKFVMLFHNKYKVFLIIFLLFFLFISSTNITNATNLPYYEDFNNYQNDSFPSGWYSDAVNESYWKIIENKLIGYTPNGGIYNHMLFNADWDNYNISLNIKGLSGIDRFIVFRVDHTRGVGKEEYYFKYTEANHGINSYIELGKGSSGPIDGCYPQNPFYSENGQPHSFLINLNNNKIKIFEIVNNNNILLFDCIDNDPLLSGGIGFFNQPNGIHLEIPTIFEIDDIAVTPQLDEIILDVLNIKQYDPQWKDEIYNHANIWSKNKPSIERWGCALTTASMILQYYNYNVSPKELNEWLNTQNDGYLINGYLNWLAISRYTQINSTKNGANLPILEVQFLNNNPEILRNEIAAQPIGRPSILKLTNHFVVAKGIVNNDFYINDPASEKNKLSEISNDYLSLIQYMPSHTDLSYIMLVFDTKTNLSIKDPSDNLITTDNFYVEKSPYDVIDQVNSSNKDIGIYYIPKPQTGKYKIDVKNNGIYNIQGYMYNNLGVLTKINISGISDDNDQSITIDYENNYSFYKEIDIDLVIDEITIAFRQKLLSKRIVYKQIVNQLRIVKHLIQKNRLFPAKNILKALRFKLFLFSKKHSIDSNAAEIILIDINHLLKSL